MTNFPCPYCTRQHDKAECPGCGAPASRIPDWYNVAALPGYDPHSRGNVLIGETSTCGATQLRVYGGASEHPIAVFGSVDGRFAINL